MNAPQHQAVVADFLANSDTPSDNMDARRPVLFETTQERGATPGPTCILQEEVKKQDAHTTAF